MAWSRRASPTTASRSGSEWAHERVALDGRAAGRPGDVRRCRLGRDRVADSAWLGDLRLARHGDARGGDWRGGGCRGRTGDGPAVGHAPDARSEGPGMSVLELTRELIARPSITTDDAGCQALIAHRLERAG